MPHARHVDNVLADGADLQRMGDFGTAGVLYATSLCSWLTATDAAAVRSDALRRAWEAEDRDASESEVRELRGLIEHLRRS